MGDMLRTMTFTGEDWFTELQWALDAVAWAVRTTVNPNIRYSPSHLAFMQDMIFRKAVSVNWAAVYRDRQKLTKQSNDRENSSRLNKTYHPGDQVLIVKDSADCRVFPNGTVEIDRNASTEVINIRRL